MSYPPPRITSIEARDPWDRLDDIERQIAALEAHRLEAISDIEAMWPDDPCLGDPGADLAHRYRISHHQAQERLRMATALRDLPCLARAHAEGRLSWAQLRWVSRFATSQTDARWAEEAPRMSPRRLQLESWRQARGSGDRASSDHAERYLWFDWDEEGRNLCVEGRLPAEHGAAFERAVNTASEAIHTEPGAADPRGAKQADALIELVTSSGGGGSARPTVVVHADVETLAGVRGGTRPLGETASRIQLHAEAVRRIACDARVRVALERDGSPAGVVASGRHVTPQQWELLGFRDRGCTYPGCDARRHLHAHHITHWADGGATTMGNLTLLCGRHHRMVHEGGWTIRGRPPDGLEFVDRWGNIRSDRTPVMARAG